MNLPSCVHAAFSAEGPGVSSLCPAHADTLLVGMFQTAHPLCENVPTYYPCTEMAGLAFAFLGVMCSTAVLYVGRNLVQGEVGVPMR